MVFQPDLVRAILKEPWAISEESIEAFLPLIQNVLSGNIAFERSEPILPETFSVLPGAAIAAAASQGKTGTTTTKQISVITVRGVLTKYSQFCGPAGTEQMARWIQVANSDPRIDAIVLRIDSPGGMVAGTETLAGTIRQTSKPVIAFVDDLAASAAYWLASECDEIIANNTTAQIGSIGVLLSFYDTQPYFEKLGVKFHTVLAPQSENKSRLFDKLRAGDYEEYRNNVLKPLAAKFIETVKGNRPGSGDDHFKGDVFFASALVGSLIDSIGSFDFALERAATLADEKQTSPSSQINMKKPDFNRLAKAAGVPQLESADGSITLTAEMAESVERSLEVHETTQAGLNSQLTERANQQSRITELEGQLQTANDRIAELSKEAGADTAIVKKETDGGASAESGDDFYATYGRLKQEFFSK
jgi:signal peptide peptidase SppA